MYAYLLDVLALELGHELVETLTLSVNTDGGEDGLDVLGRGGLVASEVEKEVSCEVLHFEFLDARKKRQSAAGRLCDANSGCEFDGVDIVREEDSRWELIKQRESIDLTAGLERRLRLPVRESRDGAEKFASEKGSRDCCVGTPSRLGRQWSVRFWLPVAELARE